MHLTEAEAQALDARVARLEARTGVDVVTAIVGRADAYPELAWRAFALGVALAAPVVVVADVLRPDWTGAHTVLTNVLPLLAIGGLSAIAALVVPAWARRFLSPQRRDGEVRQYAQALFLTRGLFRTRSRLGVLLLLARFEHRIELIADVGFDGRVGPRDWQSVVDAVVPRLPASGPAEALSQGLDRLEALLAEKGFVAGAGAGDDLPNRTIEEAGDA